MKRIRIIRIVVWLCYLFGFALIIFAEYLAHDYMLMYTIYETMGLSQDAIFYCGMILFAIGLVSTLTIEDNSAIDSLREWLKKR